MEYFQKNFLTAEGRLNRWKYFKLVLILGVIQLAMLLTIELIFSDEWGNVSPFIENLITVISVAVLLPYYFLTVQRVHDFNQDDTLAKFDAAISFYLIVFTPEEPLLWSTQDFIICFVGAVLSLYILFKPGTRGENQYGADPLGS